MQKAQSIIARVKKPTEAEAKALASYFPSTASRKRSLEPSFDLSADCVVSSQQKKKSASKTPRLSTITVVVMKKYERAVPRGKRRQKLSSEGRVKPVKLRRSMSSQEVKNAILHAFDGIVSNFTVLECDQFGHNLFQAEQNLDGEAAVQRRGCIYLCEEFKVTYIILHVVCIYGSWDCTIILRQLSLLLFFSVSLYSCLQKACNQLA